MSNPRPAQQAGRFYPQDENSCRGLLGKCFEGTSGVPAAVGAVVPHAGWVYSGATAALGIAGVVGSNPDTVVIFGAVHVMCRDIASVFDLGAWATPLGSLEVDEALAAALVGSELMRANRQAHEREHSIEVQLPLLKYAGGDMKIVPVMVAPCVEAVEVGREVGRVVRNCGKRVAFLASTDLTHYGPAFQYEPAGHGREGIRWAKDVNDRRLIGLIEQGDGEGVIADAEAHRSACGAGAVAALLGAMEELRYSGYEELRHTTSADVELARGGSAVNSVGYEAGIFRV